MRELDWDEVEDLIRGCAVLGTGGGGSPARGLALLRGDREAGRSFRLISPEEVPDDAWAASPYMCGSVSPEGEESSGVEECLRAFAALERFLGVEFHAAVATEIGGGNTAVALSVAARKGVPLLDADPAGRSVPELEHSTFAVYGVPIAPLSVATPRGDLLILAEVESDGRAEELVRTVAVLSGNHAGVTDHPLKGSDLKRMLIPGTITKALEVGRALREAKERGEDPVAFLVEQMRGYLLFRGRVKGHAWEVSGGFTVGEIHIEGQGEYRSHTYRIWYKNEHIVSWFDDKPDVMAPDLICVLDARTGDAITNPNCREGIEVGVVGFPAPEVWRTERGLELLGPCHFGFPFAYRPIEENPRLM
ncbi:DUF917 domain-containing protein [Candidatus Bipolaricaulota sp. J31]